MSKQIALQMALSGLCALMIGLAGCSHNPPPTPAPPRNAPPPMPESVINQIKNMSPQQQQAIMAGMKNTPQGPQLEKALQNGNAQGGSGAPPASTNGNQ